MPTTDELLMRRCFDLARQGAGHVAPNPMVGAVLVHEGRIIGEGFHQKYGEAHAEVNAIGSVQPQDRRLIAASTLYVSLEPCCIFGRTPPCTNLIIEQNIPKVVISCLDATPGVAGQGVQLLRDAGVEVTTGILQQEGEALAAIRNTFVQEERPYIILKYAQSQDGFMGQPDRQVWISNAYSKRLAHKWRSEVSAILVGTNTAALDNPQLTNRLYFGKSPLRIVLDRRRRLSPKAHLFNDQIPTWIVTEMAENTDSDLKNTTFIELDFDDYLLDNLLQKLYEAQVSTLLVEGGAQLLRTFVQKDLWDEARIFVGNKLLENGIPAPTLRSFDRRKYNIGSDLLYVYRK